MNHSKEEKEERNRPGEPAARNVVRDPLWLAKSAAVLEYQPIPITSTAGFVVSPPKQHATGGHSRKSNGAIKLAALEAAKARFQLEEGDIDSSNVSPRATELASLRPRTLEALDRPGLQRVDPVDSTTGDNLAAQTGGDGEKKKMLQQQQRNEWESLLPAPPLRRPKVKRQDARDHGEETKVRHVKPQPTVTTVLHRLVDVQLKKCEAGLTRARYDLWADFARGRKDTRVRMQSLFAQTTQQYLRRCFMSWLNVVENQEERKETLTILFYSAKSLFKADQPVVDADRCVEVVEKITKVQRSKQALTVFVGNVLRNSVDPCAAGPLCVSTRVINTDVVVFGGSTTRLSDQALGALLANLSVAKPTSVCLGRDTRLLQGCSRLKWGGVHVAAVTVSGCDLNMAALALGNAEELRSSVDVIVYVVSTEVSDLVRDRISVGIKDASKEFIVYEADLPVGFSQLVVTVTKRGRRSTTESYWLKHDCREEEENEQPRFSTAAQSQAYSIGFDSPRNAVGETLFSSQKTRMVSWVSEALSQEEDRLSCLVGEHVAISRRLLDARNETNITAPTAFGSLVACDTVTWALGADACFMAGLHIDGSWAKAPRTAITLGELLKPLSSNPPQFYLFRLAGSEVAHLLKACYQAESPGVSRGSQMGSRQTTNVISGASTPSAGARTPTLKFAGHPDEAPPVSLSKCQHSSSLRFDYGEAAINKEEIFADTTYTIAVCRTTLDMFPSVEETGECVLPPESIPPLTSMILLRILDHRHRRRCIPRNRPTKEFLGPTPELGHLLVEQQRDALRNTALQTPYPQIKTLSRDCLVRVYTRLRCLFEPVLDERSVWERVLEISSELLNCQVTQLFHVVHSTSGVELRRALEDFTIQMPVSGILAHVMRTRWQCVEDLREGITEGWDVGTDPHLFSDCCGSFGSVACFPVMSGNAIIGLLVALNRNQAGGGAGSPMDGMFTDSDAIIAQVITARVAEQRMKTEVLDSARSALRQRAALASAAHALLHAGRVDFEEAAGYGSAAAGCDACEIIGYDSGSGVAWRQRNGLPEAVAATVGVLGQVLSSSLPVTILDARTSSMIDPVEDALPSSVIHHRATDTLDDEEAEDTHSFELVCAPIVACRRAGAPQLLGAVKCFRVLKAGRSFSQETADMIADFASMLAPHVAVENELVLSGEYLTL